KPPTVLAPHLSALGALVSDQRRGLPRPTLLRVRGKREPQRARIMLGGRAPQTPPGAGSAPFRAGRVGLGPAAGLAPAHPPPCSRNARTPPASDSVGGPGPPTPHGAGSAPFRAGRVGLGPAAGLAPDPRWAFHTRYSLGRF